MYNQDNREKVKRDELKYEEEERLRKAKYDAAESEHRRQILLQRARGSQQRAAVQVRSSHGCASGTIQLVPAARHEPVESALAPVSSRSRSGCTV